MEIEKRELYRAVAEMAYVIAQADHGLSASERIAFYQIIREELAFDAWAAESRFELLDEVLQPSLEKAYNESMHEFRKYRAHLTEDLKQKSLRVLNKIAEACSGFSEKEAQIMDRFSKDINSL